MQAARVTSSLRASSSNAGALPERSQSAGTGRLKPVWIFSGSGLRQISWPVSFRHPAGFCELGTNRSGNYRARCFRIRATNGPPSRRRTELRRRPPDHPPDYNRPQFPEDFNDSEGSDIDLEYLASGGRQAKTPRVRQIATQDNWILKSPYTRYLLGGMFILGIAAGIALDSVINLEPNNVASREVIDRQTPNPDICLANGMSALVLDQRLFVSFNP